MNSEDWREMQTEEIEAIQAIYMDDYVNYSEGNGSPEIVLKLTPLQSVVGKDVHARVDLRVLFTTRYPYDPPVLKLENAKGISNENLKQLFGNLNKMALSLCGEVMVLQLAHHVQEFLHSQNVPSLSFHDQMLANQKKQETMELLEQKKLREAKYAEDEGLNSQSEKQSNDSLINKFSCLRSDTPKISVVVFKKNMEKKFFCSSCVAHYFDGACTLTAIEDCSGKIFSVVQWNIKSLLKKSMEKGKMPSNDTVSRQVQLIEQESTHLSSKVLFDGIISYHMLEVSQDNLNIKLLVDNLNGLPLSSFIQKGGVPISFIREISEQLIEKLEFLHSLLVIHRDLNLCNTFISSSNKLIISGYGVMKRISDYVNMFTEDISCDNEIKIKQDVFFHSYQNLIKPGKKGDIFYMGLILLSLYTGKVDHGYPIVIPNTIMEPFNSFLKSCLAADEKKRLSLHELAQHKFVCEKLSSVQVSRFMHENVSKDMYDKSDKVDFKIHLWNEQLVSGKSRLKSEFEDIHWLGKGGFGSVLKARNKLDSNFYAVKRIPLNPKSSHLNKRITREVKLLSRLNHENVVRYYNSWIEAEDVQLPLESNTESDQSYRVVCDKPTQNSSPQVPRKKKSLEESLLKMNMIDDFNIEKNTSTEQSWCEISKRAKSLSSSSSSSFSSDENNRNWKPKSSKDILKNSFGEMSEAVVFEIDDSLNQSDSDESDDDALLQKSENVTSTTQSSDAPLQFLYIQMEFCEKQTLKSAIDEGLYKQPDRVWKLFREIVEGIAHVHAQGIIHRDLKPVNIFLDFTDRIKIGDFGLATSHASFNLDATALFQPCDSTYSNDDRMTGKVGTALYVAPELGQSNSRIKFSQKVDIYSLGIILFEMFYHFETSMERVKNIALLRTDKIIFPQDFTDKKYEKEKYLISWLLNHSPDSRPTALELMESGYLPPRIEDSQLDELIKHTLFQKNSTRYQRLISAFFTQSVSPVSDQIYDSDLLGKNENHTIQQARILQYVQSIMTNILKKHGAVFIDTPLLTPKGKNYENIHNLACVLDPSGLQLCLPVDSRLSFSRFIIRNKINHIRRYCFSKLYKDFGIKGAHPVESWDCSFDIVSNSFSSFLPEAEIMYSVYEIIKEFPSLTQRNLYIRLNHSKFIEAIFLQNGFSDEAQQEVYHILEHVIDKKQQNSMLKDFFIYLGLPEHVITRLLVCFTFEGSLAKAKESLQLLCKSKAEVSTLAKQAFSEIEKLIKHLKNMFVDIPVHICTSLIHNSNCYSGLIFQYVAENHRKNKYGRLDIIAVGGCYDKQIESLSKYAESTLPHAVGVSLEVEYFLHAARKDKIDSLNPHISNCGVIVCSLTSCTNLNSLVNVIRDLWAGGISAVLYSYDSEQSYTIEDIQNYCKENSVNHIVAIKDSFIGVRSREKEKFGDWRALSGKELNDYLNQRLLCKIEHRTESREVETVTKANHLQPINSTLFFTFVSVDKIDSGKKKKFENSFCSKFLSEVHRCFGNNSIQVVATKLERLELMSVAAYLELNGSNDEFDSSVRSLMDMFKERGQFMKRVCNTIHKVYTESRSVVLLYSYVAECYKVFT
nr:eIF-2-alpha kinase GCN2-like isoform X2 [Hydra vulgaris]